MLHVSCFMNIIVLGPQGSGKGTQAQLLAEKFSFEHIDMGKTLREVAKTDTPLGKEIYAIQNITKTLVPSRILKEVLHLKLGSLSREQGLVIDGAPRTMDQASYLEEALLEFGRKISKLIFINISEETSIERISKRWVCEKCKINLIMGKDIQSAQEQCPVCEGKIMQRVDDTPEGVHKRLEIFRNETMLVIEYFRGKNLVLEIDGQKSIEEVFEEIVNKL